MTFQLAQVVPWGRSFDEYVAMFGLSEKDLGGSLLGCADGPASFNCELTRRGGSVVSIDPLYSCTRHQIARRVAETFQEVMAQTRDNVDEFVWKHIASVEELGRLRLRAMRRFLSDYEPGRAEGRYRAESLPTLSFPDNRFSLTLCSHLLFLYGEKLDLQFHVEAIQEMCRVAQEARIFPLLELGAKPSRHLAGVREHFSRMGYAVEIASVAYEFQRGGNRMLRVRRPQSGGSANGHSGSHDARRKVSRRTE